MYRWRAQMGYVLGAKLLLPLLHPTARGIQHSNPAMPIFTFLQQVRH
jgi:hypothetical protein